jgi:phosphate butyryltransferase
VLPTFADLFRSADDRAPRTPLVAAGGADPTVIQALDQAARRGWVVPIVTGSAVEIRRTAAECAVEIDGFRVIDAPQNPVAAAVTEVRTGRAHILMKGQVPTPELVSGILDRQLGLRTSRVAGQIVLMEILRDGRRFLMTDTGITTAPTLAQKVDLLHSMLAVARALGCRRPRIAVMSATEKPTPALPDTEEAAELARRGSAGAFGDCHVEGPLSFDLAYSPTAAARKRMSGQVAGGADGMLFPNLLAANLTVKAMMYTAECRFGGVLCGAACPIAFMSRADDVPTRLRSIALALAMGGQPPHCDD